MAAFCTADAAAGILAAAKVSVKFSAEPPKLVALRFHRTAVSAGRGFKSLNIRGNSGSENFKVRAMAELVEETGTSDKVLARRRKAEATHNGSGNGGGHSQTFLNAKTEEELFLGLQKEIEAKRLPASAAAAMKDVYQSYQNAVFQSENPTAKEIVLSNMATAFDRILLQFEDPFTFSSYHKAIREPFDYYMFGQNYIRPLIDFRNSYVGNLPLFDEMEKLVMQGHNIVLISNHQSEADPAVIALSLEGTHPYIAERITYMAGDRVVLDPVCKTFSMGRNLLCVYSKKHINDVPQLAEMKRRANARTLKEMALLLRKGGQILWIAPSGGRDRPDPVTKEWFPASFDVSSVDNMRRLLEHSRVPGHFYPLAVLSHDIMPPPPQVEKEIGEKRIIGYHGVGISLAPEKKFNEIAAGLEDRGKVKEAFSKALYDTIVMHYNVINSAIHGGQGMDASTSFVRLCQPWQLSSGTSTFERLSDSLRHGC